jgi:hypothetical protein
MKSSCPALDNKEIKSIKVKSKDVVSMETIWEKENARYLVIQVSKSQSFIDVLPLEQFYDNKDKVEAPVLSVPFYMIKAIKKIDKINLLFLANHLNPHIIKALEGM